MLSTATGAKPTVYTAAEDAATEDISKQLVAGYNSAFFNRAGKLTVSFAGDGQTIACVYFNRVNATIKAK